MMSTRLVVHKLENDVDCKILHVIIKNEGEKSEEIFWSKWTNSSETFQEKTDSKKSPHLVVKTVNELECNNLIRIDEFAKVMKMSYELYIEDVYKPDETVLKHDFDSKLYTNNENNSRGISCDSFSINNQEIKREFNEINQAYSGNKHLDHLSYEYKTNSGISSEKNVKNLVHEVDIENTDSNTVFKPPMNPLEYSIEKVKENNAKIMQNIHMLNKTLNYTKKREILDLAMRYNCESCGKCFVYESGLRRHKYMRHSATEAPVPWQLAWTCTKCFQLWPDPDLATEHTSQCYMSEVVSLTACVREIKTCLLLQCEFCEKVFTSIPRLQMHSLLHTTRHNYECKPCDLSFISYKNVEQHWLSCPWLNQYYHFCLPKRFYCNICEQNFLNYEQLYTHRYKVGHFTTKLCYDQDLQGISPNLLVYQCEMCAKWFRSIPLLQSHKRNDSNRLCHVNVLDLK